MKIRNLITNFLDRVSNIIKQNKLKDNSARNANDLKCNKEKEIKRNKHGFPIQE